VSAYDADTLLPPGAHDADNAYEADVILPLSDPVNPPVATILPVTTNPFVKVIYPSMNDEVAALLLDNA
jgi:hypothetical protein